MVKVIFFNSGTPEWNWLSNFSLHPITDPHGVAWPTAEHLYQAAKSATSEGRRLIHAAGSAVEAKRLGRTLTLRPDWETRKVDVMKKLLRWKFEQHPDLARRLVETAEEKAQLVHRAPWDTFWGDGGNGWGQNILGQLLEELADEMRGEG